MPSFGQLSPVLAVFILGCGSPPQVRHELVYQPAPEFLSGDSSPDIAGLVEVIDQRLNRGERWAKVEPIADGQVKISVYGKDPQRIEDIKLRLLTVGLFRFRIVANPQDHSDVCEVASQSSGVIVRDLAGSAVARWVSVRHPEELDLSVANARRNSKDETEVLVILDRYNVTGRYFASVTPDVDANGLPCVAFKFNSIGSRRFGALTGNPGHSCQLAMIMDGHVIATPMLRTQIKRSGTIRGEFTDRQVHNMCAVLSSGPLPYVIEQVSSKKVLMMD